MTARRSATFVVIPAYNEGRVLKSTLLPLLETGYSIVVVDDGSRDGTWDVLQGLPVHALRHPINLGQGAALQTGMTFALNRGAEFIVHFDADGQHSIGDIDAMLDVLRQGQVEVVLGSRFLRRVDREAVPGGRRLVLRAATFVNFALTGMLLSDAHNGLRALSRRAAACLDLRENGFAHASEILYQVRKRKLPHVEYPTHIRYTEYSQEKGQSALNGLNIVFDLLIGRFLN
jgi:polyprenyl-phospho-N-acetylgalactosaminyl synthase